MTPKQSAFVAEYLIDLNATQAAIRAGYSEKTAYSQGERLLRHVEVAQAVREARAERAERTAIDQDWVLAQLTRVVERCCAVETFNAAGANGALNLVGKHLGMFGDKIDVNFNATLAEKLMQAMSRAKAE